jgi:hypothetical protein
VPARPEPDITDKVFLAEPLEADRVARPKTLILRKENLMKAEEAIDNPNRDGGVEDKVLGEDLYQAIIGEMVARLDRRRAGRR